MQFRWALGSALALMLFAGGVSAAELSASIPSFHELRIGGSAQDPWSPEKGSGNITGEVLFSKPFTTADPVQLLHPATPRWS
jgi:hypothetical protein